MGQDLVAELVVSGLVCHEVLPNVLPKNEQAQYGEILHERKKESSQRGGARWP